MSPLPYLSANRSMGESREKAIAASWRYALRRLCGRAVRWRGGAGLALGAPRVWLLLAEKVGDNAQVRVLAEALGLPFEVRRLVMRPRYRLGKPRFRPTLRHLDLARSDPLEPPWPDLILTIGRRCAMVALWIKRRSGGRSRIVLVGRPRQRMGDYDLLLVPPQYPLPDNGRAVALELPLMRVDPERLARAREQWRERLAGFARPLTAVLVGGATRPYRLDGTVADRLLRDVQALRARDGGSLFISTSRRTPESAATVLARAVEQGAGFYRFRPEGGDDNPYLGLLAHADRFVVTGDSVSMLVEVARLGRPLAVYPLPVRETLADWIARRLLWALAPGAPLGGLGRALRALGLIGVPRDLEALHRRLYERGLAVPFGAPFPPPRNRSSGEDELVALAERVRRLVAP